MVALSSSWTSKSLLVLSSNETVVCKRSEAHRMMFFNNCEPWSKKQVRVHSASYNISPKIFLLDRCNLMTSSHIVSESQNRRSAIDFTSSLLLRRSRPIRHFFSWCTWFLSFLGFIFEAFMDITETSPNLYDLHSPERKLQGVLSYYSPSPLSSCQYICILSTLWL